MRQSIPKSLLVQTRSVKEAIDFSNDYAPEHLILHVRDAKDLAEEVQNAGSVFIGPYSPERWAHSQELSVDYSDNHGQLWGLRLWYESHASNKRIRSPVQRGQHPVLPETHHFPRAHERRLESSWTYRRHTSRRRGARRPRECSQNPPT
jgi:hypothetical protein